MSGSPLNDWAAARLDAWESLVVGMTAALVPLALGVLGGLTVWCLTTGLRHALRNWDAEHWGALAIIAIIIYMSLDAGGVL